MITLTLPYPVSANRYWRSYAAKGRRGTVVTVSAEALRYRSEVAAIAIESGVHAPFVGRVDVSLMLYPARPVDWLKRAAANPEYWDDSVRCIDLGNAEKVLFDALNGIAWIDDRQVMRITMERMEPDAMGARALVCVSDYRRW